MQSALTQHSISRKTLASVAATSFALAAIFSFTQNARAAQLHPGDIIIGANIGGVLGGISGDIAQDMGLLVIDPASGNRTVLSDNTVGSGPAFPVYITSVTFQSDGSLLVAGDYNFSGSDGALLRVDPATGNRTLISSAAGNTGPGAAYWYAQQVGDRILMSGGSRIVSVDPTTGNRTEISGPGVGAGPAMNTNAFVVDGADTFVSISDTKTLLRVDSVTGNRTEFSSPTIGAGPLIGAPWWVSLDNQGRLFVTSVMGTIYLVDKVTGDRTRYAGGGVGTGPTSAFPSQFGFAADGTIYFNDTTYFLAQLPVLRLDPVTRNRTILSDATHGTGPLFDATGALAIVPNVPEPSTFVLAALGTLALFAVRWKR